MSIMGIITLVPIAVFVMVFTPSQSADLFRQCIFSQISGTNDVIFKFKTSEKASVFSLRVNETPFKDILVVGDSKKGTIKLAKSLWRPLVWRDDKTVRATGILLQRKGGFVLNRISIEFIILKEGFADSLLSSIIATVDTLAKPNNPFRPISANYPIYKKLHSIIMQGTRREKEVSLAECKFEAAFKKLVRLILNQLKVNKPLTSANLGPQGILSPAKLQELIEATGCIPEIENPVCPSIPSRYRTIDGTCNNVDNPTFGAADTGFTRLLPAIYFDSDGLGDPVGFPDQPDAPDVPNPSIVVDEYIAIQAVNQGNSDNITHMFMQWGQFLDHDLTLAPESENGDICEEIPCDGSSEDFENPCFAILPANERPCIRFIRSAARCPINGFKLRPKEQINVNTAYIDGSMIYGSSEEVANAVRELGNDFGLLRVSSGVPTRGLLPIDNAILGEPLSLCENLGSCFLAGDVRVNEQAALAAIHTLWVREHNLIATRLRVVNPHWDGERIYQETRKIVGAEIQKITYDEWLPVAVGPRALQPYSGYKRDVDAGISNAFATAAFRLGHSLVRPKFEFLQSNFNPFPFSPVPLKRLFFNNTLAQLHGIDGWLVGMVGNVSQEMDNEMAIGLTDDLFVRDAINREGLNLAALNIQRGRDHGLPFYSDFLAKCYKEFPELYPVNVSNVTSFDQIRRLFNPTVLESLRNVYNDDPKATDLFPPAIGELSVADLRQTTTEEDGILGPTITCLLIDQFQRLRDGDRFFYKRRSRKVFTPVQRRALAKRTFSDIICSNIDITSVPKLAFKNMDFYACNPKDVERKLDIRPWRERVTRCDQNPCRNGGTCRNNLRRGRRPRRIRCICRPGFNGRFCQNRF